MVVSAEDEPAPDEVRLEARRDRTLLRSRLGPLAVGHRRHSPEPEVTKGYGAKVGFFDVVEGRILVGILWGIKPLNDEADG